MAISARVLLQQCLKAKLQVKLPTQNDGIGEFVEIKRGVVLFLCFYKGAAESVLEKLVKTVLNVKLSESDSGDLVSILDLPGDVLIVPQACLGGKMKGKCVQYHSLVNKDEGMKLYEQFTELCAQTVLAHGNGCQVKWGTYGNRQVLSTETNGPYTHVFDL